MKTIKKVFIKPEFVEFIHKQSEMRQGILRVSDRYNTVSHLCLCGCGNLTVTPLNNRAGWRLFVDRGINIVSLTPSIGNYNFDCKSHYIINNNIVNFV